VLLSLSDVAAARTVMREISEIMIRRPDLGTVARHVDDLRTQLTGVRQDRSPAATSLTAAEIRLLPLLATHLAFAEIAEALTISIHTVKSQVTSIYRKLGANTRSQAVARSRELGLLEGPGGSAESMGRRRAEAG
jgi:LuxR family transcriptional regulator, maltose regulon positive regulatory protein